MTQARLEQREQIARKLAAELPDKHGMNESQKLEAIRFQMAALEAETVIKAYLPYLKKQKV